jgi:hypothetical protein
MSQPHTEPPEQISPFSHWSSFQQWPSTRCRQTPFTHRFGAHSELFVQHVGIEPFGCTIQC